MANLLTDLESLNQQTYTESEITLLKQCINTLKNFGKFVSSLFKKTTILTVEPHPEDFTVNEKNIRSFFKDVADKEKKAGNPTFWIDDDIWNWDAFKNKTFVGFIQQVITTIYRFLQNLTHRQIIDEGKNTKIYKVYSFVEALCIAKTVLLSGEVETRNSGVFVYFQISGSDQFFRFYCYRFGDGLLSLDVDEVGFDNEWNAGHGVCFSNEPSVN